MASFDLAWLLAPVGEADFLDQYYERRPLHVARGDAEYYAALPDAAAIDGCLAAMLFRYPDVAVANVAAPVASSVYTRNGDVIDVVRLYEQFEAGGTLVFNAVHMFLPALAELCGAMQRRFSQRFQSNVYLTPPTSQGLRAHYDNHDVFVLQLSGSKRWTVYDRVVPLPHPGQYFEPGQTTPGEASLEVELGPGDLLYLPRGTMHDAVATTESLHVALGLLQTSWADLLLEVVGQASLDDAELRRALPVGYADAGFDRRELVDRVSAMLAGAGRASTVDRALDSVTRALIRGTRPRLDGQLGQLRRLADLGPDTVVAGRPHLMYAIDIDGDDCIIRCYDTEIVLPAYAAEAARAMLHGEPVRISAVAGELDDAGKLVLARKLIREGLILARA